MGHLAWALRRLREGARRLHEREGDGQRLGQYVLGWQRWRLGGMDGMKRPIRPAPRSPVSTSWIGNGNSLEAAGIEPGWD